MEDLQQKELDIIEIDLTDVELASFGAGFSIGYSRGAIVGALAGIFATTCGMFIYKLIYVFIVEYFY